MDTASILIGSVLLLLFIGPVLYVIWRQSLKDKKSLKILTEEGNRRNLKFDHTEVSNSLLLGLDSHNKKLVAIEPANEYKITHVDLVKIIDSKILKKVISNPSSFKDREKIMQVSIELMENSGVQKYSKILFYDEDGEDSEDVGSRLTSALKWEKLIKSSLSA
ncbi:hypothetical protein RM549_07740 [Salegentibacter sp. F188]|uniref:ATP synthase F0 subunit 8 n=1 Tax=Autumnicola patrickiae TaxID=3075591 RepID=A0ABU3E134_9FLAO|nr:hypothetical protein [Salegentibacter sp. F188]MDT0689673.1 hypothetical protein [Salegentibacter sp. F188]